MKVMRIMGLLLTLLLVPMLCQSASEYRDYSSNFKLVNGLLDMHELSSAPATPSAAYGRVYVLDADGDGGGDAADGLYIKFDTGTVLGPFKSGTGTMSSFILGGDGGTPQTIEDGNTASILGGTGLTSSASATDTLTLNLDNTAVTPGAYTSANITVDAQGRITLAASGSGGISGSGTDNHIMRWDGTGAAQDSTWTIGDSPVDHLQLDTGTTKISLLRGGSVRAEPAASGTGALQADVYGDVDARWSVTGGGEVQFGDGTNPADTIYSRLAANLLGLAAGDAFVIGSTAGDHASTTNGTISYNSSTNKFRAYENGAWADMIGGGGYTSWTLAGDAGTPQTISSTNTATVAGGTNGIDTSAGATDTVTLNMDYTEISTATFGSGSDWTWTFNVSGTDPTMGFSALRVFLGADSQFGVDEKGALTTAASGSMDYSSDSTFSSPKVVNDEGLTTWLAATIWQTTGTDTTGAVTTEVDITNGLTYSTGDATLDAGTMNVVGRTILIEATGVYDFDTSGVPPADNCDVNVYYGTTLIATAPITPPGSSTGSNLRWRLEVPITVFVASATVGEFDVNGATIYYETAPGTWVRNGMEAAPDATVGSINTTTAQAVAVKGDWAFAAGSTELKCRRFAGRKLN